MDKKSKEMAAILALFLGGLGMHRFYLGGKENNGVGLLYLVMCWTWIPSILACGEAFYFMFSLTTAEFDARYNNPNPSSHG